MNRKTLRKLILGSGVLAGLPALLAVAAVLYDADTANFGYVASPTLNQQSIRSGNAVAYVPWFDTDGYHGDLLASPVGTTGEIDLTTTSWRAAEVMTQAETAAPGTYWDTGRFIVTMHPTGIAVPFRKDFLDKTQTDALVKDQDKLIAYLRGSRTEEGKIFPRIRASLLGPFIHSNPVYVGYPDSGYPFGGYLSFATANKGRPGRIYVGGNDGMLHAFDAETGRETFAYIPSALFPKLRALSQEPYTNTYYVDGPLTAADVYYGGAWHTVLIGTLGHGGKGIYALDVTSADPITSENNTFAGAGSRVMWELDTGDLGGGNLGYTHGKVAVGKMANGRWVAVVPNGYNSAGGLATLLFVDIGTGSVIREIIVGDSNGNGMSAPTLIDTNNDHIVDYAYAGDINGNVWKFDLTAASPAGWSVAFGGAPLFQTEGGLSITVAPEVGLHPKSGYMVYVATGRLLSNDDAADATNNIAYGIWDDAWPNDQMPIVVDPSTGNFLTQSLALKTHAATGEIVRVASDANMDWSARLGWRVSLAAADETAAGWRVVTPIALRSGRLHFMTSSPLDQVGKNWYLQLDAMTGGAPDDTIVDINRDGALDIGDNVDGNGDGEITDVAEDRVVGVQKRVGLASAPIFGRLDRYSDAAIFNHLAQINQIHTDTPTGDPDDLGILGGHFDLDVASQTYALDNGTTDMHTHEWDDKFDATVVDLFDIWGGYRSIGSLEGEPGSSPTKPFLITIVNAHLSTAGILEINGIGTPVVEHRQLIKRVLSNNLLDGERAPLYTLAEPTPEQYAAGVRQLTSLKLRFPETAILAGGLIGTNTGCVRGNDRGFNGEYRNGSLTVQLLDASVNTADPYAYDPLTEAYYKPTGGSHRIHRLGYAVPYDSGPHRIGDGMMHETVAFWHWGGPCYSPGEEASYAEDYATYVGEEWVPTTDDDIDDGTGGTDEPPREEDPGWDGEPLEFSEASTTVISASDRLGRLFWREIVPED